MANQGYTSSLTITNSLKDTSFHDVMQLMQSISISVITCGIPPWLLPNRKKHYLLSKFLILVKYKNAVAKRVKLECFLPSTISPKLGGEEKKKQERTIKVLQN